MKNVMIKVINIRGIESYRAQDICKEMAGQKAMGLLTIPKAWRLPFFVISKEIVEEFMLLDESFQVSFCSEVSGYIGKCVCDLSSSVNKVIIRSSGEEEGMNERGKYDSIESTVDEIDKSLLIILKDLKESGEKAIAYIVQPYLDRKILGHLSNERRISQYARDWKVEYEGEDREPYAIGIRKWRTTYDLDDLENDSLQCMDENTIKQQLRKIAYYYTEKEKKQRIHFEFVWDGMRIYLVQKDFEIEDVDAKNPMEYNINVDNVSHFNSMKVFRKIEERDGSNYKKAKNVLMYKKLGLITAPLYILDDKKIITDMSRGIFSEDVKHDFLLFREKSVVIRTDVATDGERSVQLLPRSNELRTYEDIVNWCIENLCEIISYEKVALLVHMFIPAISAAFAYAEPNSRVVTIQSLWGLPEGLYYNAHDTFLLDTGTRNIEHIDEKRVLINSIIKDHKAVYISPDDDGMWIEKKVKSPFDWKTSISETQAKKIAIGSRIIAQSVNKAISVMWFVGIDMAYYGTDCLPWFHEVYGNNTFSHDIYKKKYYTEKEVVISSEEDLIKYEADSSLKTITIHPKDDKTLRNRNFIDKVGTFAKENNITIFLEGTILAHPVYALLSKGVRIILAKKNKELIGKNNFNKLVRDKIPDKIVSNMEQIECYRVTNNFYIRYLKEKLIEEVYEICDSNCDKNLLEELADAYEVLMALYDQLLIGFEYKDIPRKRVLLESSEAISLASIEDKSMLQNMFEEHCKCEFGWINFMVEREHQCIELEITINREVKKGKDICQDIDEWNDTIVRLAYQILDSNSKELLSKLCKELSEIFMLKLSQLGVNFEDFEAIRHNKNDKNGGFNKGYVLRETKMRTESQKNDEDIELPIYGGSIQEEYQELTELLFDPITYIDYRKNNGSELIIRIKYPLCLNIWQNEFVGRNVDAMFGEKSRLQIKVERVETRYSFFINLHKETYEQLKLIME